LPAAEPLVEECREEEPCPSELDVLPRPELELWLLPAAWLVVLPDELPPLLGGLPPPPGLFPPVLGGLLTTCCTWPAVWFTVVTTLPTTCCTGLSFGRTVEVGTLALGVLTPATPGALPPSESANAGTAAPPSSAQTSPTARRRRIPMSLSSATSHPA
jgi:hypothetical protein